MDVAAIHGGFLKGARAAGGVLRLNAEVAALERKDGRWAIRLGDGETIHAANIVNASGAWADVVAGLAGAKPVGLVPEAAHRLHLGRAAGTRSDEAAHGHRLRRDLVHRSPRSVSSSPRRPTKRRRSLAMRSPKSWISPLPSIRIETATSLQIRRIKNKWAGLRSFVADKNLVAGYDPKIEGFFLAGGPGRLRHPDRLRRRQLAASLALGKGLPSSVVELGVTEAALSPGRFAA